jgi:endonuclease YncB( thermonuclease family)
VEEFIMSRLKKKFMLVILIMLSFQISAVCNTGVIKKVLSGDLVQIGDTFVARLTGITAPPRDETLGYKIYDFTKRELEGKTVKIFTWTTDNTAAGIVYDENGYPFVEIEFLEGESLSFNEILLQKGYARVDQKHLPENLKHYLDVEREAREKGLGIWQKEQ